MSFHERAVFEENSAWEQDDHFYRSYLLNWLVDHLADVYSNKFSAKDIWNALEDYCKNKKKLSKSHLIKFLGFKFDDDTEVLPQVKEHEKLVMKLKDEKINLCNTFISDAIVNKLPPSWISFSIDIRRRNKQVSLSDLKRFIQIEHKIRTRAKK